MAFAPTLTPFADSNVFIAKKLSWDITSQKDAYDTWAASEANAADIAPAPSGEVLSIHIPMTFIDLTMFNPDAPKFVTKGSGACLRDVSAGTGGFCILETNDSYTTSQAEFGAVWADWSPAEDSSHPDFPGFPVADTSQVWKQDDNKGIEFFRLTSAQFDAFENAWNTEPQMDPDPSNGQDSRCYREYLNDNTTPVGSGTTINVQGGGTRPAIEGVDYPKCTHVASPEGWECTLALPGREDATDGHASFSAPGMIAGYFIAGYLNEDVYDIAMVGPALIFNKVEQLFMHSASGATSVTTYALATIAAIASLLY